MSEPNRREEAPPGARRLNHGVLVVAAAVMLITVAVVVFVVAPRAPKAPAARPAPLSGSHPGFLEHPPGNLPAPAPLASEQEYMHQLLLEESRRAEGRQAEKKETETGPEAGGLMASPAAGAPAEGSGVRPAAPAGRGDARREAFVRALVAPLATAASPATGPAAAARASGRRESWEMPLTAEALPAPAAPETPEGLAWRLGPGSNEAPEAAEALASRLGLAAPPAALGPLSPRASAAEPGRRVARQGWAEPEAAPPTAAGADALAPGSARQGWAEPEVALPLGAGAEALAPGAGARGEATESVLAGGLDGQRASGQASRREDRYEEYLRAAEGGRPGRAAQSGWHAAAGRLVVRAGTVIPVLLLSEVNSDLPGPATAQVERNVYDQRQEAIVIPKGTRLLGRYDHQVAVGQRRLLIAWTRLLFVDGSSLELPGLPAATASGAAGLAGAVDNHYGRIFGDALLLSILAAGAQLSQPQQNGLLQAPAARQVAAGALGGELASVATELLRRDIAIQPTLRIPAATEFNVFVNDDLVLPREAARAGAAAGGRP
ncbi:MAG TPA: TrbI/VirB10 family protein [Thermoanaerobaculia bacterium]|nr:TrbI/VirB10 family protein [Thermoanaerobaculia bacterium]